MLSVTVISLTEPAQVAALRCGTRQLTVPCAATALTLALPQPEMMQLGLHPGDTVNLYTHPSGQLQIGPLVGVLLGDRAEALLTGSWRERYHAMTREARAVGAIPFFFRLEDLDLAGATVEGYIERSGTWQRRTLPLPDVIYHRAAHGKRGRRKMAKQIMRDLRTQHGIVLINSSNYFAKSVVAEALAFFPETRSLTPETVRFGNVADLITMLDRHRCLFVKAEAGSHGTDVLRICRETDGFAVRGAFGGQRTNEQFASRAELIAFLDLLLQGTPSVIQQGIDLPELDGRVFDVRVIVQKDGSGQWRAPLVLVRLAQADKVAANMSQGGHPFLPGVFHRLFGGEFPALERFEERAVEAATKTALALESRFGLQGEMGIDLGLDCDGRPWVFEANTKPLHPMLPDLLEPLTRYPFHYAVYLAARAWDGRFTGLPLPTTQ